MATARAKVNNAVLLWARESARLEVEEAARKAQVKPERLEAWERGDALPTINELRLLGRAYKRPFAL